jgi:hypothetical protein
MSQDFFIRIRGTDLALDGAQAAARPNTRAILRRQASPVSDRQLWTIADDGLIRNKATGLVLDVVAPGATAPVITTAAAPERAGLQQWEITPDGRIRNRGTGMVLELEASRPVDGARIMVNPADAARGEEQSWEVVRYRTVPPEPVNLALQLDGTQQLVELPPLPIGAGDFTIEAWVSTGEGGPVVASGQMEQEGVLLGIREDGSFVFALLDPSGGGGGMTLITGRTGVLDDNWHHVACVRQGTEGRIYLDGEPLAAAPHEGGPAGAGQPVDLGTTSRYFLGFAPPPPPIATNDSPLLAFPLHRYHLAGRIDEVRVWAGARAQADIAVGMHRIADAADPTLLGLWSFDDRTLADRSPAGRHGTMQGGAPVFVPSGVDLVPPGEPYLVTQARLIQDYVVAGPGRFTEISGYRTVVSARRPDGAALSCYITLWATEPAEVHFADGTRATLESGGPGYTRRTTTGGELSFTLDAGGRLTCPMVKVRADFMAPGERLVIAPDRHVHGQMAALTPNRLLGRDEAGQPLAAVARGRKRPPLAAGTDPAAAAAVAQAIGHVMSAAVEHDLQPDRPLTRARSLAADLPLPRPYTPRYQDLRLVSGADDPHPDAIATHFLDADQDVVRVLAADHMPAAHWAYDRGGAACVALEPTEVAERLARLAVEHRDAFTRAFQLDPAVYRGERTLRMRSDEVAGDAARRLAERSFLSSVWDGMEDAADVIVSTVETTVEDVASGAREVMRAVVVTVVTGVRDAVTGLIRAWDAVVQTVEDALDFVRGLLRTVGARIHELLDYLKDLFEWDDILATQRVMEKYLVEMRTPLKVAVDGAGSAAVGAIRSFRARVDREFDSWRGVVDGRQLQARKAAVRSAPASGIRSSYFFSMLSHALEAAKPSRPDLGDRLQRVLSDTFQRLEREVAAGLGTLPDRVRAAGLENALADPERLVGAGIDLLLACVQAVADTALELGETVVRAIADIIDVLLDALHDFCTTRISLPLVTDFYEQVVMEGDGSEMTPFSMIALLAAIPMTVAYKAISGRDEPVFSESQSAEFLRRAGSDYDWIRSPFGGATAPRGAKLPLSQGTLLRIGWAQNWIYAASLLAWGTAATVGDSRWVIQSAVGIPTNFKFEKPLGYVVLGAQAVCLRMSMPLATDFARPVDQLNFAIWASQVLPLVSNCVAVGVESWGNYFDAAATGGYGVAYLALILALWVQRDQEEAADRRVNALEGVTNLFASLTLIPQLGKYMKGPAVVAIPLLDAFSYLAVAAFYIGRTSDEMVRTL